MTSFVNRIFTVSSFESDFPLVLDVDGEKGKKIVMPEGIRYETSQKVLKVFFFFLESRKVVTSAKVPASQSRLFHVCMRQIPP